MNIYERALALKDELLENRRYLHYNAEAGLHMPKAKAYIVVASSSHEPRVLEGTIDGIDLTKLG